METGRIMKWNLQMETIHPLHTIKLIWQYSETIHPVETHAYSVVRSVDGRVLYAYYCLLDNGMVYMKNFIKYLQNTPASTGGEMNA